MDSSWTYGLIALFLLAAYVSVRRSRTKLESRSRSGYQAVACGIGVLFLSALLHVTGDLGGLSRLPFLSEEIFFDLVYWISVITGSTILISGAANWLPSRRERESARPVERRHLELIRLSEQLLGVETRLQPLTSGLVRLIKEELGFQGVALLRESRLAHQDILLAVEGDLPVARDSLLEIGASGRAVEIPNDMSRPELDLAVRVAGRRAARLLIWPGKSEALDSETTRTIRLVVDVLERQMELHRLRALVGTARSKDEFVTQTRQAVLARADSPDRFREVIKALRRHQALDLALLTFWREGEAQAVRYSCGQSGRILIEKNYRIPTDGSPLARAYRSRVESKQTDSDRLEQGQQTILDGQARSLVAFPIKLDQDYRAVLMFASKSADGFRPRFEQLMREASKLMPSLLSPELEDRLEQAAERRLHRITDSVSAMTEAESISDAIEVAALALSDSLQADLVRIAQLDTDGKFLESMALISSERIDDLVPANGQMILSLMPDSHQSIMTGQPVRWQVGEARESQPIERRQLFRQDIKALTLVPIVHLSQVVGLIAAGWMDADDQPTEIGPEVRLLAGSLAALMKPIPALAARSHITLRRGTEVAVEELPERRAVARNRLERSVPTELTAV